MKFKENLQKIEPALNFVARWRTHAVTIGVIIASAYAFYKWGSSGPFKFVIDNLQVIGLILVALLVITLWIRTSRLEKRFTSRFKEEFEGDLQTNWDFEGPWRLAEKGVLVVTGSDAGGITKVGSQWENYTLTFQARIVSKCLGVIVRALDLNNYYMFQIQADNIYPHRRAEIPVVETKQPKIKFVSSSEEPSTKPKKPAITIVRFIVGWEVIKPPIPIEPPLKGWFNVKLIVRGESVRMYINDDLVLQKESFLKIPTGKVGFRNAGSETAYVRKVRVTIQP